MTVNCTVAVILQTFRRIGRLGSQLRQPTSSMLYATKK